LELEASNKSRTIYESLAKGIDLEFTQKSQWFGQLRTSEYVQGR